MELFPPEVLLMAFAYLDQNSLLSANRVCKAWHKHLSPVIWRDISLLRIRNHRHPHTSKAFWAGVRRNGSSIRRLRIKTIEALDPFLQEEGEQEDEDKKEKEGEQKRLDEDKEGLLIRPRRPCVSGLVDLNINCPRISSTILKASHPEGNLAWFKNSPPRLVEMLRNNPGLESLTSSMWLVTAEWYYKRRLLSPVPKHDLGHVLKVLNISVDMPKNDRSDPLYWLLRNLPQTLQELSMTILSGKSNYYTNHELEEEFKGLSARSLTTDEALAELERYDNERDRRMDLEEETEPTRPIPSLPLKSLKLGGSYPLPQPGMDGCSIGSTFVVHGGETQLARPAYFLEELEQLIRQCRPTLESLTMDMGSGGCLFVTGVHPKKWFGLKELARIVGRSQGAKSRSGSILQSLSKFSTSTEWADEDLAVFLNLLSTLDNNQPLVSASTSWDDHSSSNSPFWKNICLMKVEDSHVGTSAAILKHVSTLESLTLRCSEGFPSRDLARIFRTSPRLRHLHAIEDNNDPKQDYGDPYLNVFMDAQDLLLPLHEIDLFWSSWTDRTTVHPQNRGWVPLSNDNDRYEDLNDWACHESLEVLQIMIKNVPRPDVTKSQYGGRLRRLRNGTLAREEYEEQHVAIRVEQGLCWRLGGMTKLKKLILGIDDRKWKDLSFYRDIPDNRLRDLGIEWNLEEELRNREETITREPALEVEEDKESKKGQENEEGVDSNNKDRSLGDHEDRDAGGEGGKDEEEGREDNDKEGNGDEEGDDENVGSEYSDNDFYWEEDMPRDVPLMFHDEGFQYSCLSLSLDAGLEHMAGLKELEVLGIERMAHRVRLREVQWMVANWPKLRRIEGLAHKQDDRCKVPRETEEAVQWLQGHHPEIALPLSSDNMREGSWTHYDHHMIWY